MRGATLTDLWEAEGVIFDHADLSDTSMSNSHFSRASFNGTILEGTQIDDVNFEKSTFASISMAGCNVIDSNFDGAALRGVNLDGVMFDNTRLNRADLADASVQRAEFKGHCQLREIRGERSVWDGTDLDGTDFGRSILTNASFRGANLAFTSFTGAAVDGADFGGARGLNTASGLPSWAKAAG